MARTRSQEPTLTLGNQIYLYGLLARELGCGKQTFLPRVEEALATEQMGAEELGFESTRALLEAMGDCVNLTVFKGGRIYATVIAQPAWDEALAAPVDAKSDAAAKGGRPWKRKRADKSLKPAKPRRVRREVVEPVAEAAPEPEIMPEIEPEPAVAPVEQDAAPEVAAETAEAVEVDEAVETIEITEAETKPEPKPEPEPVSEPEAEPKPTAEPELEAAAEEPQPSISLTITYDPYSDSDEVTTLEASRETLVEVTAQTDAAPKPEIESAPKEVAPTAPSPSPEALASYPRDFAHEVYCPAEHLAELNHLLPLGTAAMPLLAEDFQRALGLGLISGTRSRATFPLRVQHLETTEPIEVTIRKQSGPGLPWALSHVE